MSNLNATFCSGIIIHRIKPAQLVIVSSRTGIGKTSFVLSILWRMLGNNGKTAYFTFETTTQKTTDRLIQFMTETNEDVFSNLKPYTVEAVFQDLLGHELPLFISEDVTSFEELEKEIREACTNNVNCIFIDSFQALVLRLSQSDQMKRLSSRLLTAKIKRLTEELNVSIIMTSQEYPAYNQDWERPDMNYGPWMHQSDDDLSISELADVFIQLIRPELYGISEDEMGNCLKDMIICEVRKNREGRIGKFKLRWNKENGYVSELSEIFSPYVSNQLPYKEGQIIESHSVNGPF